MRLAKIFLTGLVLVLIRSALAEEGHRHRPPQAYRHNPWHGEIHRFHEHDLGLWRGGRWQHGRHDGRLGWWWIVGGAWYFYPSVVYPYPDPYQPSVVTVAPSEVAPQYWYYCSNPAGYYPYVAQCSTGWQRVPASPSQGDSR
ncbi:MAG: hypothetical protein PHQ05_09505 [Sterolibacterium sp.]|nr:hypothetical protein [Sterolibacterium sp.]